MTKVQLLEQFTEIDILNFYVEDFNPKQTENYKSPFSEHDNTPSLSVYHTKKGWQFKSHNTGHQGDVFQFVADLKGIDCKSNFTEILDTIKTDLSHSGSLPNAKQAKIKAPPIEPTAKEIEDKKKSIKLEINPDKTLIHSYFKPLGISPELLEQYNIQAIKYHEFTTKSGKLCKFDYVKLNQLAILYTFNDRIQFHFVTLYSVYNP
jgi:CHC2 zinc finger